MDNQTKPQDYHYWMSRPIDDTKMDWNTNDKDWIEGYWNSANHPHRELILKELRTIPFSNLLEVGCNIGPNLKRINDEFPKRKLVGLDINAECIKRAKSLLPSVQFKFGGVSSLVQFRDKIFDILLCDAVLMYVGPEDIYKTIKGFDRITRKAIILVEWYDKNSILGKEKEHHWARNYKKLMEEFGYKVAMKNIKEIDWPTPKWFTLGKLFVCISPS